MSGKQQSVIVILFLLLLTLVFLFAVQLSFAESWAQRPIIFQDISPRSSLSALTDRLEARKKNVTYASNSKSFSYSDVILGEAVRIKVTRGNLRQKTPIQIHQIDVLFNSAVAKDVKRHTRISQQIFRELRQEYGPAFVLRKDEVARNEENITAVWLFLDEKSDIMAQLEFINGMKRREPPSLRYKYSYVPERPSRLEFFYIWLGFSEKAKPIIQKLSDWGLTP